MPAVPSSAPPDAKAHLPAAEGIVDALPWRLGDTDAERRRARVRVASLTHQVAAMLASGDWSVKELRDLLAKSSAAARAPDATAQQQRWRSVLKRARLLKRRGPLWWH
ncbi:hypothetical protein [Actinoplanes sp. NPDC049118]|uniref:hypothetical protein n=1 Tax=Actinoplanes sp. NPDC049118 TaxID=3155769 RepID=UPI0033E7887A